MLHLPFLQTPVSRMFPVPPSQVCPSVLAPEAAAILPVCQSVIDLQILVDETELKLSLPFELPLPLLFALLAPELPPPRGMARACPANMAVMIQVKVENCISWSSMFSEFKLHRATNILLSNENG